MRTQALNASVANPNLQGNGLTVESRQLLTCLTFTRQPHHTRTVPLPPTSGEQATICQWSAKPGLLLLGLQRNGLIFKFHAPVCRLIANVSVCFKKLMINP